MKCYMFLYTALGLLSVAAAFFIPDVPKNESTFDNEVEPRVRYGTPARITDHPYFASLGNCGGAIISSSWIVTAAHCVDKISRGRLWVGGECHDSSQAVNYQHIIIHPQYNAQANFANDIALLKLDQPLRFSDRIKPIGLPYGPQIINPSSTYIFVGKGIDETGGSPRCIQKSLMKIMQPASKCLIPGQDLSGKTDIINLCIKRADDAYSTCKGDSGSPLAMGNTLVGLVSWGYQDTVARTECAIGTSFFVNVMAYVPWIKQVTAI